MTRVAPGLRSSSTLCIMWNEIQISKTFMVIPIGRLALEERGLSHRFTCHRSAFHDPLFQYFQVVIILKYSYNTVDYPLYSTVPASDFRKAAALPFAGRRREIFVSIDAMNGPNLYLQLLPPSRDRVSHCAETNIVACDKQFQLP